MTRVLLILSNAIEKNFLEGAHCKFFASLEGIKRIILVAVKDGRRETGALLLKLYRENMGDKPSVGTAFCLGGDAGG